MEWYLPNYGEEDPLCLFCKSRCEIESSNFGNYDLDKIICSLCQEYYIVVKLSLTNNIGFIAEFSCENFIIYLANDTCLSIRTIDNNSAISIDIPEFEIDLSNKVKLLEKIKTYLLFS